jgi:hypothetical protein
VASGAEAADEISGSVPGGGAESEDESEVHVTILRPEWSS